MRAIITSVGEPTTGLCYWSLQRNGFDAFLLQDSSTSLWEKLKWIYDNVDSDFLRVDGDVVPNINCTPRKVKADMPKDSLWHQFKSFDWYKQDVVFGGVQLITKEALPTLRANIGRFAAAERPETQMFRLDEFHNPRKCTSSELVMGLHGFAQGNHIDRVKETKKRRKYYSDYDWELYDKLQELEVKIHAAAR